MQPVLESTDRLNASEFSRWVAGREHLDDGYRYELLNGRVVMTPPAGWPHGSIEARIVARLSEAAERVGGRVFGSSQGFELPTGDVIEADATFVSAERWRETTPVEGEFLKVVPDLVVEILSRKTQSRDRGEKRSIYESAGVREYWLVDPKREEVVILGSDGARFVDERRFGATMTARAGVVDGFEVEVATLFA